jgi:hypothetical protein
MATQKRTTKLLLTGSAGHTRSSETYMGALLDAVSIDDWREVVTGAVQAAKGGDAQARAWLGQYLIGRPESKAPTPINVVVGQWQGANPVIDKLTGRFANSDYAVEYSGAPDNRAQITRQIEAEIAEKLQQTNATE